MTHEGEAGGGDAPAEALGWSACASQVRLLPGESFTVSRKQLPRERLPPKTRAQSARASV